MHPVHSFTLAAALAVAFTAGNAVHAQAPRPQEQSKPSQPAGRDTQAAKTGTVTSADTEFVQELYRMLLDLVGADRQDEPCLLEPVESLGHAGIEPGADADILPVMDHELPEQLIEMVRRQLLAGGLEAALDQRAGACAD